jgi:hypothetical protein
LHRFHAAHHDVVSDDVDDDAVAVDDDVFLLNAPSEVANRCCELGVASSHF